LIQTIVTVGRNDLIEVSRVSTKRFHASYLPLSPGIKVILPFLYCKWEQIILFSLRSLRPLWLQRTTVPQGTRRKHEVHKEVELANIPCAFCAISVSFVVKLNSKGHKEKKLKYIPNTVEFCVFPHQ
jgi:hypothetical protein